MTEDDRRSLRADLRAAIALLERAAAALEEEAQPEPMPAGPRRRPIRYLGDTEPSGGDAA